MKNFLSKICYTRLIFSIILSFCIFLMNKIVFLGFVFNENYMELIFFREFVQVLLFIPPIYIAMWLLEKLYTKLSKKLISKNDFKHKIAFCSISFAILLIVYLIYYFTFFPGGVYIDTYTSLKMLNGTQKFTNQQPILYTLSLNLVKAFGSDLKTGFAVFTFIQILLMVATIVYFIYWLLCKKVNTYIVAAITIFFAAFKLYPLYSISIWKDTPFSLAVFLYTLSLIDLIFDFNKKCIKPINIFKFSIFMIFVILFRNNGIYITVSTLFILLISYFKEKDIINIKAFIITSFSIILALFVLQKSYSVMGIETDFVENLGIPIQQIARVVVVDGNITDEQKELIEKVLPIEDIKDSYLAMLVDHIKWHSNFDSDYLESHKLDYLKLWIELFFQNPAEYFKAYFLETSGFWTFNVKGEEAYVSPTTWETIEDIENENLVEKFTGISLWNTLLPHSYLSGGFFFWVGVISFVMTIKLSSKRFLIAYVPAFLLWATIMIATPIASSLRYVFSLVMLLPLNIVFPIIANNNSIEKDPN